jgi:hypothetical protein
MFLGLRLHATTYGIEREGCVEGALVTRGENWNGLGLHEAVEVRIAIITGSADAIVDAQDHSCRLHRQVPESTLAVVPGLGHLSHYSARAKSDEPWTSLCSYAHGASVVILTRAHDLTNVQSIVALRARGKRRTHILKLADVLYARAEIAPTLTCGPHSPYKLTCEGNCREEDCSSDGPFAI